MVGLWNGDNGLTLTYRNPCFKCQNSLLDYFDAQVVDECKRKLSYNIGYWSDEMKKHFATVPHWSIDKWISVLEKGGGQRKRFQYCLNPNCPHRFLYFRGRTFRKYNQSALQDNVLLPEVITSETEKLK